MKLSSFLKVMPALFVSGILTLTSCSGSSSDPETDSGDNGGGTVTPTAAGHYFLGVKTDDGSEFVMQASSLEDGDLNVKDNIMELPQTEYTWIFNGGTAIGMVYQQQYAGLGYALKYDGDGKPFKALNEFQITTRFSNYGFFNGGFVTSVAGQVDPGNTRNDGCTFAFWNITDRGVVLDHTKTIWTENMTNPDGQQVTFSSIVDNGDGTFMTSMVQSAYNQVGTNMGSSIGEVKYPDSVWVAKMDKDLNVLKIYKSDKLSYSAGSYRSQVFQQVFKADDGTVYVFSNAWAPNTTREPGALRINKGADDFDPDYYFDLLTPANGYKFRRVWHISGDKFLLEIYNDLKPTTISSGHQFAIVSMGSKDFKMVTGLPAKNQITSGAETGGVPLSHDGKIYLPITTYGADACIYVINPESAVATKGITIKGVREVRTVGYIQ